MPKQTFPKNLYMIGLAMNSLVPLPAGFTVPVLDKGFVRYLDSMGQNGDPSPLLKLLVRMPIAMWIDYAQKKGQTIEKVWAEEIDDPFCVPPNLDKPGNTPTNLGTWTTAVKFARKSFDTLARQGVDRRIALGLLPLCTLTDAIVFWKVDELIAMLTKERQRPLLDDRRAYTDAFEQICFAAFPQTVLNARAKYACPEVVANRIREALLAKIAKAPEDADIDSSILSTAEIEKLL